MKKYFSKNGSGEKYKFIPDFKIKQILNGDIPIFSLKSSDTFLKGNTSFKIFEYNCVENIKKRIDILSLDHKKEQLEFIQNWINT
jgi:lantibiotic modifying enzyme